MRPQHPVVPEELLLAEQPSTHRVVLVAVLRTQTQRLMRVAVAHLDRQKGRVVLAVWQVQALRLWVPAAAVELAAKVEIQQHHCKAVAADHLAQASTTQGHPVQQTGREMHWVL